MTPLLTSLTETTTPPQIASHDTSNSSLTLHISVVPQTAPKMNTSKFLNRKFLNIVQETDLKHTVAPSSQDNYTT
jgi:hypothetical protein